MNLAFFLFCFIPICQCYKILVTSVGTAASQHVVMGRLADILGSRGNDVTLLKWMLFNETKSIKLKYAKEKTYKLLLAEADQKVDSHRKAEWAKPWQTQIHNFPITFAKTVLKLVDGCRSFLEDEEAISQLKKENYDVVVLHLLDFCLLGLTEELGIKRYIWFPACAFPDQMAMYAGVPSSSSFVPTMITISTDHMSFWVRMKNFFTRIIYNYSPDWLIIEKYTNLFQQKYGPRYPSLQKILSEAQLYMVYSEPFVEFPRPVQHNIIFVGGFVIENAEPLKDEWKEIVENSRSAGIVLFSFGTVVQTSAMPIKFKEVFLKAFIRFQHYTFICRMEGDIPEVGNISNINLVQWIPQRDLLGNPKVRAFISHGGYNTLMEATSSGVPLVILPLFNDQPGNAKKVESLGIGVTLDQRNLTEQAVYEALNHVLNNQKLQDRADRLALMIKKKPVSSHDMAVKWIEYLAEFKNLDTLKPVSRHLGIIEYLMFDIVLFLFIVSLVLVSIV